MFCPLIKTMLSSLQWFCLTCVLYIKLIKCMSLQRAPCSKPYPILLFVLFHTIQLPILPLVRVTAHSSQSVITCFWLIYTGVSSDSLSIFHPIKILPILRDPIQIGLLCRKSSLIFSISFLF